MDLPIALEHQAFVSEGEELNQSIYTILLTPLKRFMQSGAIGSQVNIHTGDAEEVEEGLRYTMNQINGVTVESVTRSGVGTFDIRYTYFGDIRTFTFNPQTAE